MIRLELPDIKFKKTYLDAIAHYFTKTLSEWDKTFEDFVQSKLTEHKATETINNRVPTMEFWIIDEQNKYCGRIQFRHFLNDFLKKHGGHIGYDVIPSQRGKKYAQIALGLCLIEAKKLGLHEVLLTCDDTNIPSIKTIERNGGILQDKITFENKIS